MRNLFIVCALIWTPAALASECYSIQDVDQRNACLASSKNDKSYCFKIQGADQRNACLAREKGDRGYCFKIQSDDLQKDCLANTPR
jgi:hypothetical protein